MAAGELESLLTELHRRDYGRILAALARRFGGDLELCEDVLQEAFIAAVDTWRRAVPDNPGGWLYRTATHKAIDRVRRQARFDEKAPLLVDRDPSDGRDDFDVVGETIPDERLRLIFVCCNPVLSEPAQLALTLKAVGGLTTPEIARGLLMGEATIAQRIVRAKRKLKAEGVPYTVPADAELCERLPGVLGVIQLIFTEGHSSTDRDSPVRADLCREAIRLGGQLVDLMPDEPEAMGLLALLYLTDARRPARVDGRGSAIPLSHQDRRRWNRRELRTGAALLERALPRGPVGQYQLQAAIAAVHCESPSWERTDWLQIATLYGELEQLTGSPVVRLNRSVAESYLRGPAAALVVVEDLAGDLGDYQPWHAARADLLDRLGRTDEARSAYDGAIALASNEADRLLLRRRRAELDAESPIGVDPGPRRSTH